MNLSKQKQATRKGDLCFFKSEGVILLDRYRTIARESQNARTAL